MREKWYYQSGPSEEVAVSSRVRLARNLAGRRFCGAMGEAERAELGAELVAALREVRPDYRILKMEELSAPEREELLEKHLVSAEFLNGPLVGRALCLSPDESVSVMVCEEDHLRIQVLLPGEQLGEALTAARKLDEALAGKLTFATDEELGYLTHCPTNVGTGLRSSVMLCLPGLRASGELAPLFRGVEKLGLTVRGLYGEGSESEGDLFQLSNQVTLGRSEDEITQTVRGAAEQLIKRESAARAALVKEDEAAVRDTVLRARGTLERAVLMNYRELLRLLSTVRLGLSEGMLSGPSYADLTALILTCGRGGLGGENVTARERDKRRAERVNYLKFSD